MSTLRSDFTFDGFACTKSTKAARRLCGAVSSGAHKAPALLVLYGPPGTGKTHLLHAIGHAVCLRDPNARWRKVSARDLAIDLWDALHRSDVRTFQQKYGELDLLLIDDVHDLASTPTTEAELLRHCRTWLDAGVHMVAAGTLSVRAGRRFGVSLEGDHAVRRVGLPRVPVAELQVIAQKWLRARHAVVHTRSLSRLIRTASGDVRRVLGGLTQLEARRRLRSVQARNPPPQGRASSKRRSRPSISRKPN